MKLGHPEESAVHRRECFRMCVFGNSRRSRSLRSGYALLARQLDLFTFAGGGHDCLCATARDRFLRSLYHAAIFSSL